MNASPVFEVTWVEDGTRRLIRVAEETDAEALRCEKPDATVVEYWRQAS